MMDYKQIVNKIKPELDKVISFFERELMQIHIGRATPSLVEDVMVDCFGKKTPLKQLAAISAPEPKQILIQPWDKSYIEEIIFALEKSNLRATSIVEKETIRLNLPGLTEEFRKNLLKLLSEKQEDGKKTIRRWREEVWSEIQQGFREGEIREDDKFRAKDELQDLVDEYNKKIEEIGDRKKKEIQG